MATVLSEFGHGIIYEPDPGLAVSRANIVYIDTWVSMGKEREAKNRRRDFSSHQINSQVMTSGQKSLKFMHCLPAHGGDEVAAEVPRFSASIVFTQAENRNYAQQAIVHSSVNTSAK